MSDGMSDSSGPGIARGWPGISKEEPTPPPRCRVCHTPIAYAAATLQIWVHVTIATFDHDAELERRVSGERRKFQYQSDERPNGQHRRNNMSDRRKAGKL